LISSQSPEIFTRIKLKHETGMTKRWCAVLKPKYCQCRHWVRSGYRDQPDGSAYLADLEADGYLLLFREINWYEHRLLSGPAKDVKLLIPSVGCPEIDRLLMFRDRKQIHADANTSVIEEVLVRACTSRG